MNKRKQIILILSTVILLALTLWYFFLKKWDYKVEFTVNAPQSVAYSFIKAHHDWNGKTLGKNDLTYVVAQPWSALASELKIKDADYRFYWELTAKNDSLTKVTVGVSDGVHSLANRLAILFRKTRFETDIKKNMTTIRDKIVERNGEFRYSLEGKDSIAEIPCVFLSTRSSVRGKADEMIRNVITLNMYVKEHDLGLNGNPMVVVQNWTPAADSIDFDFCFPVLYPERIPTHPEIGFRLVSVPTALRADFYGNYSYSDYTWNLLFAEAQKKDLQTSGRIVEIFYNDPHNGGNDLDWKAGIYLELKK